MFKFRTDIFFKKCILIIYDRNALLYQYLTIYKTTSRSLEHFTAFSPAVQFLYLWMDFLPEEIVLGRDLLSLQSGVETLLSLDTRPVHQEGVVQYVELVVQQAQLVALQQKRGYLSNSASYLFALDPL